MKVYKMNKSQKLNFRSCRLLIVSIFSFILGCMITINLVPIDKTCKIEDKEYNIMQSSKLRNPDLMVFILSAIGNIDRRNTIRETWLKLKDRLEEDDKTIEFKIRHYFVIGGFGHSADDLLELSAEQSKFSDVLILPMYDSYANLTQKVLNSFVWLNDQLDIGLDFKYILKCDDDSFVRIDNLAHELIHLEIIYLKSNLKDLKTINDNSSPYLRVNFQSNENLLNMKRDLYWGYFSGNASIKTHGKWKESDWIMCDFYLPYALGGGYVLSKNLIIYLAGNVNNLRYYKSEDVSVGAWLASVNNILRIHDKRFDTEWKTRGCQNYYLISHGLSTDSMRKMYENILQSGNLCDKEVINRSHYLYNWLLPPSKCCHRA